MTAKLLPKLLLAGYVQTAPACGDCLWSSDEPQGLFCRGHMVLVDDNARCTKWSPAEHWLRANPAVAQCYTVATQHDALSHAELVYAHKDHALTKPSKQPKWPFPTASK